MNVRFNIPFNNSQHFHTHGLPDVKRGALFKGKFAKQVRQYFLDRYQSKEVVLTASCTNALELAALLLNLQPGDEVIIPSYTYVSTANAFELHGARLVICDSEVHSPNLDLDHLEKLISPNTKAVVVVHYAGIAPDMTRLQGIARRKGLVLIEDAAHSIDAYYDDTLLGSFGDLSVFSFHETKNISCGQGGALLINNPDYVDRARILRDCGTDRHHFVLGLVDKYTWVDVGSVYNLSELNCAYLAPQLEQVEKITRKRVKLWEAYYHSLRPLEESSRLQLPVVRDFSRHNAHIFYLSLPSQEERDALLAYLREKGIASAFHYGGLHQSPYYRAKYGDVQLPNAEKFAACLLRLPLYYDLSEEAQRHVLEVVHAYFREERSMLPGSKYGSSEQS
ncbi:MAG: dTDP-4-amino-4,6-dideoxygalactose transaminase [Bacteroidetes bacterium]|nr:MAG: dTDP-4-amino-4,6-dideoxygalactose transaminase [Bacteroidota bacterium]